MLNHRHTPLALLVLSLFSNSVFANTSTSVENKPADETQTNERLNVLIKKGFSAPNATTQNYSGDTVIKIVPTTNDINKPLDQLIAENSPGFVHTNSGTSKHNSNNYHRGLSDKYTLYLLNGVAFPTSTLGSQNLPDIPMESVALIEVIRGAQASLYGSSSLTGVINIITKTGDINDAQFNISAGSHDSSRIGGVYADNIDLGAGKLQFMTSLDVDQSDGYDFIDTYDQDLGYESYSMNSYGAYVTNTNRFSLAINNGSTDLDIYESYPTAGKAKTTQDSLQFTGKYIQLINQNLSTELTLSTAKVDLEAGHHNSSEVDHYSTRESLAQLHVNIDWGKATLNTGGEFIHSKYKSNQNGEDRDQNALYMAFSADVTDYLNVSGGIRNDHYSDFGDAQTYSAGISLYDKVGFSYKTSFTAPSYNDLYWPNSGNPDLEAEEGEIYELSFTHNIETKNAHIPLKLNLYTGTLDNKIEWAPIAEGSWDWSPFNIGEVDIKGVETYVQYNAAQFVFDISGAYSQSTDKSTDKQLNNVPKWSGSSSIQYNITNSISPKFTYSYIGERSSTSGDLDEVHLLDFAITYQAFKHVNIGFNINNITDNDQQIYDGYNADGRTYLFTIGANM